MNPQHPNPGRAALAVSLLTLLAACGSGGSAAPTPAPTPPTQGPSPPPVTPPPSPPTGNHKISGEVLDFATGMIAGADVNLWVQLPGGSGYSYAWVGGALRSDGLGLFEASRLPDSSVTVLAHKDGYVQPCVLRVLVEHDSAIRVEMIRVSALQNPNGPQRPQLGIEPWLTGVIYETTAAGRVPVPGVDLWVESSLDIGLATSQSEPDGQFFLCNLGPGVYIHVSKPGFRSKWVGPVDASATGMLDIEIERW